MNVVRTWTISIALLYVEIRDTRIHETQKLHWKAMYKWQSFKSCCSEIGGMPCIWASNFSAFQLLNMALCTMWYVCKASNCAVRSCELYMLLFQVWTVSRLHQLMVNWWKVFILWFWHLHSMEEPMLPAVQLCIQFVNWYRVYRLPGHEVADILHAR